MGGEIERQNKQLDKIGGKTDVADVNIDRANARTEIAEVDYLYAQSNSSYHAHYLKDSRICWLGLLRKTMVVKCLYVETIVPLKDLNAFKQKSFRYSIFLQTIFLMYNFIFIESSIQQMFQTSILSLS